MVFRLFGDEFCFTWIESGPFSIYSSRVLKSPRLLLFSIPATGQLILQAAVLLFNFLTSHVSSGCSCSPRRDAPLRVLEDMDIEHRAVSLALCLHLAGQHGVLFSGFWTRELLMTRLFRNRHSVSFTQAQKKTLEVVPVVILTELNRKKKHAC